MATSRLAKVTASSLLVLATSTSASLVLFLKKGKVHVPQTRDVGSVPTGPFVGERPIGSYISTWSDTLPELSSYIGFLKQSTWPLTASFFGKFRQPASVKSLQDRFCAGDYYVWLYRDTNNQATSWEKYTITDVSENGVVVINMSTKFSDEEEFITHHRMTVNLADNLKAIEKKDNWKLCGFEYRDVNGDDGVATVNWKQFGVGDNVQAFEEKFDVFNMLTHPLNLITSAKETRMVKLNRDVTPLVRTSRHGYTQAWYAPPEHSELSGIAVLKDFKEHSFSLIEVGRNSAVQFTVNVDNKRYT